jgi:hypothetical protein
MSNPNVRGQGDAHFPIHVPQHDGPEPEAMVGQRFLTITISLSLSLLILSVLILAYVPPVSRDAITHHLAVPKLWILNGGAVELPHILFSYYPMNIDLLYVIPMLFGNDIIPKYIHFLFALLTAWLIYRFLKDRTNCNFGLLGALIFLSTPVILKLSITAYVDLGLVFFSWSSMFFLFKWARSFYRLRYLIIAAIFCGLGLGTKYNGLLVLFLITLLIPIIYTRSPSLNRHRIKFIIGYPLVFALISLAVFSPWMIRNTLLTKNPIFPLYDKQIYGESRISEISNRSMKPWLQRKLIYKENAMETAMIPLRIFFQGRDDDPQLFDGRLNPLLIICPLLLFLPFKIKEERLLPECSILSAFAVCYILYASFMVDMRIRYIAPTIPPLVVLSVLGLHSSFQRIAEIRSKALRSICKWTIVGFVTSMLALNAAYAGGLFRSVDPMPFISGNISREAYLENKLPEYPAIQYLNQLPDTNMKILALFVGRHLYYFDRAVDFDHQRFAETVKSAASQKSISSPLVTNGFSYCIIGIDRFTMWANQTFSKDQIKSIEQWLKDDCHLLFSKNGYAVFALIPKE